MRQILSSLSATSCEPTAIRWSELKSSERHSSLAPSSLFPGVGVSSAKGPAAVAAAAAVAAGPATVSATAAGTAAPPAPALEGHSQRQQQHGPLAKASVVLNIIWGVALSLLALIVWHFDFLV